jgi:hypothetical protein
VAFAFRGKENIDKNAISGPVPTPREKASFCSAIANAKRRQSHRLIQSEKLANAKMKQRQTQSSQNRTMYEAMDD